MKDQSITAHITGALTRSYKYKTHKKKRLRSKPQTLSRAAALILGLFIKPYNFFFKCQSLITSLQNAKQNKKREREMCLLQNQNFLTNVTLSLRLDSEGDRGWGLQRLEEREERGSARRIMKINVFSNVSWMLALKATCTPQTQGRKRHYRGKKSWFIEWSNSDTFTLIVSHLCHILFKKMKWP